MAPKNLPWPEKGERAFVAGDSEESLHLDSIMTHFPQHAESFKLAAEMVIDAYQNRPRLGHRDELFFPIVYLYRHSIELKLKDVIQVGMAERFFTPRDKEKLRGTPATAEKNAKRGILQDHNLVKLWGYVRKLLIAKFPNDIQEAVSATEPIIQEFHRVDPTGQVLRYERDNDGERHQYGTVPEFVSLENLRSKVDKVFTFLDCCQSCLIEELSGWDGP